MSERREIESPSWLPPLKPGHRPVARIEVVAIEVGPGQYMFVIGEDGIDSPLEMIGMLESAKLQAWGQGTGLQVPHTHN